MNYFLFFRSLLTVFDDNRSGMVNDSAPTGLIFRGNRGVGMNILRRKKSRKKIRRNIPPWNRMAVSRFLRSFHTSLLGEQWLQNSWNLLPALVLLLLRRREVYEECSSVNWKKNGSKECLSFSFTIMPLRVMWYCPQLDAKSINLLLSLLATAEADYYPSIFFVVKSRWAKRMVRKRSIDE